MLSLLNELEDYNYRCTPEKRLFLGVLIRIVQDAEMIKKHIKKPKRKENHRDYYDLSVSKIEDRRRELVKHLWGDWVETICNLVNIDHIKFAEIVEKILHVKNGDYLLRRKQVAKQVKKQRPAKKKKTFKKKSCKKK